jgi:hypothetical protein
MKTNHPHIVHSSKDLFFRKTANEYTCGIRITSVLQILENKNIMKTTTAHNHYLVLESSVMGDYDRYAEMMFSFIRDNGMSADTTDIFAVYNAERGFNKLSVKIFCPVKIVIK